jgi:hypothetical protein
MLADSTVQQGVKAGTTVYKCAKYDYGLSSDDTCSTGVEHVSVTLDPTGDYPFFTIPLRDLEIVH